VRYQIPSESQAKLRLSCDCNEGKNVRCAEIENGLENWATRENSVRPGLPIDLHPSTPGTNLGKQWTRFGPELPVAGIYDVLLSYMVNPNRAMKFPVMILDARGDAKVAVNQQ